MSDLNRVESHRCRLCPWLLSITVVAILLLLVEVVLQLIDFNPSTNSKVKLSPELGWVLNPSSYPYHDEVQSTGFRSASWKGDCPAQRTVAVLGDSFSFAAAVVYRESFPGQVETLLNTNSKERWCVINLSIGDWGNVQQLLAFNRFFADQAPRFVIWQIFPFNDFCNSAKVLKDTCSLQDHFRPYLIDAKNVEVVSDCGKSRLVCWVQTIAIGWQRAQDGLDPDDHSTLHKYFRTTSKSKEIPVPGAFAGYLDEAHQTPNLRIAWQQWEDVLGVMTNTFADRNVESFAFMIPYARSVADKREKFIDYYAKQNLDPTYAFNRVKSFLQARDVTVIDFSELMEQKGLLTDDMFLLPSNSHLSKAGHAASARQIVDVLREHMRSN